MLQKVMWILIIVSIVLYGCSSSSSNKKNEDEWEINIHRGFIIVEDYRSEYPYLITLSLEDYDIQTPSHVFKINGVTQEPVRGHTIYSYPFDEGTKYDFQILSNGHTYKVSFKIPYQPTLTYVPTEIDLAVPTKINWTMSGNNEFQFVSFIGNPEVDGYLDMISTSARTYTFPPNSVSEHSLYIIGVIEANYSLGKKISCFALVEDYRYYYDNDNEIFGSLTIDDIKADFISRTMKIRKFVK